MDAGGADAGGADAGGADAGGAGVGAGPGVVCNFGVVDCAAATEAKEIKDPKQASALTPHASRDARFE